MQKSHYYRSENYFKDTHIRKCHGSAQHFVLRSDHFEMTSTDHQTSGQIRLYLYLKDLKYFLNICCIGIKSICVCI